MDNIEIIDRLDDLLKKVDILNKKIDENKRNTDDNFGIYKEKTVILLGLGKGTQEMFALYKYNEIEIDYICDNNKENFGKVIEGILVISPHQLQQLVQKNIKKKETNGKEIIVQVSINNISNDIENQLLSLGVSKVIKFEEAHDVLERQFDLNNLPKVSVVIPIYNVEKYLELCLDNIINQSYRNLEIILIDDGSTDNSGQICYDYFKKDDRIKVIHQQKLGLHVARNIGIEISTGEHVHCIDDVKNLIDSEFLFEKFFKKNLSGSINKTEKRDKKIIVSLTTFPPRINDVCTTLLPIFQQTVKPDKIMLWLKKDEFPNLEKDLPKRLLRLKDYGLDIMWCNENLKPHNKYWNVMQKYPDDIIITIDDDIVYDNDLVENLYNSYKRFPTAVSALRTHYMTFDDKNNIKPYQEWDKECSKYIQEPKFELFATGCSGVLYPPNCMHKDLFDLNNMKKLCFGNDDIWLKYMQLRNNTQVVLAKKQKNIQIIAGSQEVALWHSNVVGGENDVMMKNMYAYYKDMLPNDCILNKE